jgi:hypothetical protein
MLSCPQAGALAYTQGAGKKWLRLSLRPTKCTHRKVERAMGIEPIALVRPINQIMLIRLPLHA